MDISILKYLDVLIGVAVVMILLSAVVTAITQIVIASAFARARNLRHGVEILITQIDPQNLCEHANYIAHVVLRHPMIGRPNSVLGKVSGLFRNSVRRLTGRPNLPDRTPGTVVEREELVRILLEFAADEGPLAVRDAQPGNFLSLVARQAGRVLAVLAFFATGLMISLSQRFHVSIPDWLTGSGFVLLTLLVAGICRNTGVPAGTHLKTHAVRIAGFLTLLLALSISIQAYGGFTWLIVLFGGLLAGLFAVSRPASPYAAGKPLSLHGWRILSFCILLFTFAISAVVLHFHWAVVSGVAVTLVILLFVILWINPPAGEEDQKRALQGLQDVLSAHAGQMALFALGVAGLTAAAQQNWIRVAPFWIALAGAIALILLVVALWFNRKMGANTLDTLAQAALKKVVPQASAHLKEFRERLVELEKSNPSMAAQKRQAQAILETVPAQFVGKINGWFDQTMDRITQKFALEARAITIIASVLIAVCVQVDSLDLMRRLSADDKFRQSLVEEAKSQQAKIDKAEQTRVDLAKAAAPGAPANTAKPNAGQEKPKPEVGDKARQEEIEKAKSKRDEIEENLAKLRSPALDIIPPRFLWERVAQVKVRPHSTWPDPPFTAPLKLVVGSKDYSLTLKYAAPVFLDLLQQEIERTGAPVKVSLEVERDTPYLLLSSDATVLQLQQTKRGAAVAQQAAETVTGQPGQWKVALKDEWKKPPFSEHFKLLVDSTSYDVSVRDVSRLEALRYAIAASKTPVVASISEDEEPVSLSLHSDAGKVGLQFRDQKGQLIELTEPVPGQTKQWKVPGSKMPRPPVAMRLTVGNNPPVTLLVDDTSDSTLRTFENLRNEIHNTAAPVNSYIRMEGRTPYLLIAAKATDVTQIKLQHDKGQLATGVAMLRDWQSLALSWPGILLSCVLLSLGAPFWYDLLKNLLKLRPLLAQKEEKQRESRQREEPVKKTAATAMSEQEQGAKPAPAAPVH